MSDTIFKQPDFFLNLKITLNRDKRKLYPKEMLQFKTFSRRRASGSHRMSNYESLCFDRYQSKGITTITTAGDHADAGKYLETKGYLSTDKLLKLADSYDGISGETLKIKSFNNMQDMLEPISPLIHIKKFSKELPEGAKLPSNFNKFLKLVLALGENITDIQMQSGVMYTKDSHRELYYITVDLFCGNDYVLSYNSMPKKKISVGSSDVNLVANTDVRFSYRRGSSYFSNRIPITTIGKNGMTQEEIKEILRTRFITNLVDHGKNNLSDDCMEITNIRSLIGVI